MSSIAVRPIRALFSVVMPIATRAAVAIKQIGRSACLIGLVTALLPVSSAISQSLTDVLVTAYQHNPQLLAERAQLRGTDEEVNQALASWRPSVRVTASKGLGSESLGGGTAYQDQIFKGQLPTNVYDAQITQHLYQAGIIPATRQARNDVSAERAHLESVEQTVLLQAITDYLDVAQDEAILALQIDDEQVLSREVNSATARFAGGTQSRVDVAQVEADYQAAIAQRQLAEADLKSVRLNFLRDVGVLPAHLEFPKLGENILPSEDSVEEIAQKYHPDVIAAEYKRRAADEAATASWSQAIPSLDLEGDYDHGDNASFKGSHTTAAYAEVRVTWPIYDGGTLESQTRQAEQTVTQRFNELELARQKAGSDAGAAWARVSAQRAAEAAIRQEVDADQVALTGTKAQQQGGVKTTLDVLNAQKVLIKARLDLNSTIHDEILEEYTLAASLGRLTAHALRLPVQQYDPLAYYDDVSGAWFGFGIPD